jgi:methylglyoxal synthase
MSCGSAMAGATFHGGLADGAVVEGVWQRSSDEFIRRVAPDDCRTFLGNRIVRIPPGTVGVVVVGGQVERLLPSGEQTTVTLFDRVANFFIGKGGTTAFYLLDLRPIPIPFTVQTRASATGRSMQTQILTSFQIPRGDREAVGMFLTNVLGPRAGFSAGDLYSLLRPEVTRIAGLLLERLGQQGEVRTAETEAELRRILGEQLARRYGLVVDVDIAPLTSTASMSFQLGADTALHTEDGVAVEIDLVVRVQGQHEDFSPTRLTPALQVATAARLRRLPMPQLSSSNGFVAIEEALRTDVTRELASFGMQLVAINVLDVRSKTGVWLLGARAELVQAQEELGMRRALLAHSGAELDVEALALQQTLRKQEIERGAKLQGLAAELESAKAEATLRANATFATDAAAIADRQRRVELQQNAAKLDTAAAKLAAERRQNSQTDELDELRHRATKDAAAQAARANLTQKELELEAIKQRQQLALESERNRQQVKDSVDALREKNAAVFDDHQKRAALSQELADRDEARQIEKLRAMAELDQKMAAQDQAHELKVHESLRGLSEREMIAMQAAKLAQGEVHAVVFLRDPMTPQPHEPDINALVRACDVHDVPCATNLSGARLLLSALFQAQRAAAAGS